MSERRFHRRLEICRAPPSGQPPHPPRHEPLYHCQDKYVQRHTTSLHLVAARNRRSNTTEKFHLRRLQKPNVLKSCPKLILKVYITRLLMFISAAKVFRFRKLLRQFYIKSLQRQRIISKFAENFANRKYTLT